MNVRAAVLATGWLVVGSCASGTNGATGATTTAAAPTISTTTSSTPAPTETPPGLNESIAAGAIEVPITLADGSTMEASFDVLEAGPADGELVVLLHGFPQSSYEWRHQMGPLADAGYHAVAVDQRGYSPGARPDDDADYEVSLLAGDVIGVADALGADTFHLVGHDWGAVVAWAVRAAAADRLDSLTAVSVPHPDAYSAALDDPDGDQSQKVGYIEALTAPGAAARFTADGGEGFLRAAQQGVASDADIEVYAGVLGIEEAMSAALAWYRANRLTAGGTLPPTTTPTLFSLYI